MNAAINELLYTVTRKKSLADCSMEDLQDLRKRYPSSAIAYLLASTKMASSDEEKGEITTDQASIFFNNPLWLDQLMHTKGGAVVIKKEPAPVEKVEEEEEVEATVANPSEDEFAGQPVFDLPAFKIEPIDPAKAELVFEPFHTVDYFASQGIAPRDEAIPKDKFGLQLKSFTEWLKTLKKVSPTELAAAPAADTHSEQQVEQLAHHSLEQREVVTETMAEVWIKQGNTAKANAVYEKLSLLNPSKSAYFASLIENLKKS